MSIDDSDKEGALATGFIVIADDWRAMIVVSGQWEIIVKGNQIIELININLLNESKSEQVKG